MCFSQCSLNSHSNNWSSVGKFMYPDSPLPLPRCIKHYPTHEKSALMTVHWKPCNGLRNIFKTFNSSCLGKKMDESLAEFFVYLRNVTVMWNLWKLRSNLFLFLLYTAYWNNKLRKSCSCIRKSKNHRITESQNGRSWKGPLWVS